MYLNIPRKGTNVLKPNSKYNAAILKEFEKFMPIKKIPKVYFEFLLWYDTGEIDTINRLYYVKDDRMRSHPITARINGIKYVLTYFMSLPEVTKFIYHHDLMFGKKGFHKHFKLLKIAVSKHDFDGFYVGYGEDNMDKIYYIDTNNSLFQNNHSLSEINLKSYEIAIDILSFSNNLSNCDNNSHKAS